MRVNIRKNKHHKFLVCNFQISFELLILEAKSTKPSFYRNTNLINSGKAQ